MNMYEYKIIGGLIRDNGKTITADDMLIKDGVAVFYIDGKVVAAFYHWIEIKRGDTFIKIKTPGKG